MTERSLAGPVPRGWAEIGVDVSDANYLTPQNWDWIRDNGFTFAMIKAFDGTLGGSARTLEHTKACIARGIEPGYTWYLSPAEPIPVGQQARRFMNLIDRYIDHMPRLLVAIDIEDGKGRPRWKAEDEPLRNLRQAAWLVKEELDTRPFLYYGKWFGEHWGISAEEHLKAYPLWASRWPVLPDRTDMDLDRVTHEFGRKPAIWQYGGSGPGVPSPIPRNLDKNVCPEKLERHR